MRYIEEFTSTNEVEIWREKREALNGLSLIDHLYNRFDGMYPTKFSVGFKNDQSVENWKDAWVEAFVEEKVTFDEIKNGLRLCRKKHDWSPSLPEFLKLCKPPLCYESAYLEAQRNMRKRLNGQHSPWTNSAFFWAAAEIGDDLFRCEFSKIKARWIEAVNMSIDAGVKEVPPIPSGLLYQKQTREERERAEEAMEELAKVAHKGASHDFMACWEFPKSKEAVYMLIDGARNNAKMWGILAKHVEEGVVAQDFKTPLKLYKNSQWVEV